MALSRVLTTLVVLATAAIAPGAEATGGDGDRVRPGLGYRVPGLPPHPLFDECSFAFLLEGTDRQGADPAGADRHQYAATAGHCAGIDEEQRIWLEGDGPQVVDDAGRPVGQFVYAVEDASTQEDFGLIRLRDGVEGNPQMCGWGGPTSLLTAARSGPVELHQHGQGFGFEDVSPNRTAVARSLPRERYSTVQGPFTPGDSGSPVTTADGAALGIVAELTVGSQPGVGIVRLQDAMEAATSRLDIAFTLRTAPLLPAPLPSTIC